MCPRCRLPTAVIRPGGLESDRGTFDNVENNNRRVVVVIGNFMNRIASVRVRHDATPVVSERNADGPRRVDGVFAVFSLVAAGRMSRFFGRRSEDEKTKIKNKTESRAKENEKNASRPDRSSRGVPAARRVAATINLRIEI